MYKERDRRRAIDQKILVNPFVVKAFVKHQAEDLSLSARHNGYQQVTALALAYCLF
jgi:hypothetical protein